MEPENWSEEEAFHNYLKLKTILEAGIAGAHAATNLHEAKGFLIDVQGHFKGLMLRREDREELYGRLQEAFAGVNQKIEEERTAFELDALSNYADLKPEISGALDLAAASEDMKQTWEMLLQLQTRMKAAKLLREHREELYLKLQEAFDLIKMRREEARQEFDNEARVNYLRLKALVEKGLIQAEETHEYKETREFLKKIQGEFKGIRLAREQREELYSRLQTAFDILGKRLDDFFRNKKKNWEVKMQFTLSRLSADMYDLERTVEKDRAYLKELEDQLDIVFSSGKESDASTGLRARVAATRRNIEQKLTEISRLDTEKAELQKRLDEPLN